MNKNLIKISFVILVILLLLTSTLPVTAANSAARSCEVRAYPGQTSGIDHNKWLDVYPKTLRTDGIFIFFNPLQNGWNGVQWSPWGIYGNALRFGVGTVWSLTHWYWNTTIWYYVYSC